MSTDNTACIFGHRKINETEELKTKVYNTVERLIIKEKVDTFLFGSKSQFDSLCLKQITKLKEKYPYIKRVYVRAEFPNINDAYRAYLLEIYDDTYYPEKIIGAGRASYVERNREIIDHSSFCVVYYDESYTYSTRKSGTKLALDYAVKRGKTVLNMFLHR